MASAPLAAVCVNAATNRADCNKPQGNSTHKLPAAAARKGRRRVMCTGAQPVDASDAADAADAAGAVDVAGATGGKRPTADIQAGCRPRHNSHRPRPSAAACSKVHNGRNAGLNCANVDIEPTAAAASAPAAA